MESFCHKKNITLLHYKNDKKIAFLCLSWKIFIWVGKHNSSFVFVVKVNGDSKTDSLFAISYLHSIRFSFLLPNKVKFRSLITIYKELREIL